MRNLSQLKSMHVFLQKHCRIRLMPFHPGYRNTSAPNAPPPINDRESSAQRLRMIWAPPKHANESRIEFRSRDRGYNYSRILPILSASSRSFTGNIYQKNTSSKVMCSCSRQQCVPITQYSLSKASFQKYPDPRGGFDARTCFLTLHVAFGFDDTNACACQNYTEEIQGAKWTNPSSTKWRGCGRP